MGTAASQHHDRALYQPLSPLDLKLSKLGLFGFLGRRRKLIVGDEIFRCWFILSSLRPHYINIKVVSDQDNLVRDAMAARVKYFNWRGQEITGSYRFTKGQRGSRKRMTYFFADPLGNVERQRLWLRPPRGARFVSLTFRRGNHKGFLGFSSKIKLKRLKTTSGEQDLNTAFETVINSRDRMRMTWFLRRLKDEAKLYNQGQVNSAPDPVMLAKQLLAKMIYLWQGVEEKRVQIKLADAQHLARFGFSLGAFEPDLSVFSASEGEGDRAEPYDYRAPLHDGWRSSGILSSQMRLEAMLLVNRLRADRVRSLVIGEGRQFLPRILVALALQRAMGLDIVIDVRETLEARLMLGEWLRWRTFLSWLSSPDTSLSIPLSVRFLVMNSAQRRKLISAGVDIKSIIEDEII